MKATLLIFFLVTGIPAGIQFKQRHDLEERAATAAHTLRDIYVLSGTAIITAHIWSFIYHNEPSPRL